MVTKMDYITIDNFEGPLDLLLHLVKESNIDILDIKIEENVIVCPHCGGKIHFDGEPRIPDHENIQGKEYYK